MTSKFDTANPIEGNSSQADLLAVRARNLAEIQAGIAHDLNGSLNAIVINLEMLKQLLATNRETKPYTEALSKETQQLIRLISIFVGQLAPIDQSPARLNLNSLLEEVLILTAAHIRHRRIRLKVDKPKEIVSVTGVGGELKQAVLTMILDALETMPAGGELRIELTKSAQDTTLQICCIGADTRETDYADFETMTDTAFTSTRTRTSQAIIKKHNGSIKSQRLDDNRLCMQATLPLGQ